MHVACATTIPRSTRGIDDAQSLCSFHAYSSQYHKIIDLQSFIHENWRNDIVFWLKEQTLLS